MADSEDEYDRKRRDKFRGERTESYRSGERREERRGREDWIERDSWSGRSRGGGRGDYRGPVRERYSPSRSHELSPPMKRMRHDWDDMGDRRLGYEATAYNYNVWAPQAPVQAYSNSHRAAAAVPPLSGGVSMGEMQDTQPPMLSFKSFLQTQDDNITDNDAIKKYNEYKHEFRRQQLNEFFVAHKEEEWFKLKYHPEDSVKKKQEHQEMLKRRIEVFEEFLGNGRIDKVTIDSDQADNLQKLLDAVVIRLEGGTDLDLQAIDQPPEPVAPVQRITLEASKVVKQEVAESKNENDDAEEIKSSDNPDAGSEQVETAKVNDDEEKPKSVEEGSASPEKASDEPDVAATTEETKPPSEPPASPKKDKSDDEGDEKKSPPVENGDTDVKMDTEEGTAEVKSKLEDSEDGEKSEEKAESETTKQQDQEETEESKQGVDLEEKETVVIEDSSGESGELGLKTDENKEEDTKTDDKPEELKPRALHRTSSLFLRNLAPSITKKEIEDLCKRYAGYLRTAIADPQPERRWFRRGWVTFQRDVNIKEICWHLNNIRVRDCELGAIVNRDLSRRIRSVMGLTSLKQIIRNDMKLAANIIQNLDSRSSLWVPENKEQQEGYGLKSLNPVLQNITDYLIEEASAEEEELLGQSSEPDATEEKDINLLKVLDRLLFYLRIVHSVDYYNHCEYPNEDEMPNRCGIMHTRSPAPANKPTQQEISDYCKNFEAKMQSLIFQPPELTNEELQMLGAKDTESEVEKFIAANTQELATDKWLCPLSGKKFKGPEFVRKHIFNKHAEKVEEVKKEVEYFNNYLRDPKRPQLPEHPGNKQMKKEPVAEVPPAFIPHMQYGYGGYQPYSRGGYGGYARPRAYNRGRGGGDYRPIVHYRDLDAPREPDEFI
ncbi:unnamed protein product [Bemisia tabaci]|uniref:Serrate RNA effector molecule homolog n=1 Tax=Bemisia tabaci TaxID=7038 RepID=A0A9P0F6Y0_BEMTA|nr:unnamed protein product [Bemisia tabaci]